MKKPKFFRIVTLYSIGIMMVTGGMFTFMLPFLPGVTNGDGGSINMLAFAVVGFFAAISDICNSIQELRFVTGKYKKGFSIASQVSAIMGLPFMIYFLTVFKGGNFDGWSNVLSVISFGLLILSVAIRDLGVQLKGEQNPVNEEIIKSIVEEDTQDPTNDPAPTSGTVKEEGKITETAVTETSQENDNKKTHNIKLRPR